MTAGLSSAQAAPQPERFWKKVRLSIQFVAVCLSGWPLTAFTQANYTTPYTFSPLAGLSGFFGVKDGTKSTARFDSPSGAAVDNASNVYVADAVNNTIRLVTPAGVVTTIAGLATNAGGADGAGNAARFNHPAGIAVDSAGNLYVTDSGNDTIRVVTRAGAVSTLAGRAGNTGNADGTGAAAQFYYPNGIAVDGAGNVYVADTDNCTIRLVTPAGVVTTLAGVAGGVGSADGTGGAARFAFPYGVALAGAGNLYVADTGNSTIRLVAPGGVVTTFAGLAGFTGTLDATGTEARFAHARGVAVDGAGNVYVADTDNCTIRAVTPTGIVTTLAGVPGLVGVGLGTGAVASFDFPFGIAADAAGNLFVANTEDQTIRAGGPDPRVFHLKSKVTITFPVSGQRVTNQPVVLAGITTNNEVVEAVYVQLLGQAAVLASTTNSWGDWTAIVTPSSGANTVRAYAVNTNGTVSATNVVAFRYAPRPAAAFFRQQGTFNGLFLKTVDGAGAGSGFFTLTLAASGAFTGKIMTAGETCVLPTTNKFSGSGAVDFTVPTKQGPLRFNLELNLSNPDAQQITGMVSNGAWVAGLTAVRTVFNAATNQAVNYEGQYTMPITRSDASAAGRGANGWAKVKVSPEGLITMVGNLGDGAAISQSTSVSEGGFWPFYAACPPSAAGDGGSLIGWIMLTNSPGSSPAGRLHWHSNPLSK